jgi:heat shock protein HslJ
MKVLLLAIAVILSSCGKDESLRAYGAYDDAFVLQSLNGHPFNAPASVSFPKAWKIVGQGPCNRFSGSQRAPYPWFSLGPLQVTARNCPQIAEERMFLEALGRMSVGIVKEFTLTLSNDAGEEMTFSRVPSG